MQDLNLRPPVCDTDALPTELIARPTKKYPRPRAFQALICGEILPPEHKLFRV